MIRSALDVSVVLCVYTEARWDDLIESVESVKRQSAPPCEIIVVVDHNLALLERVRSSIPNVISLENRNRPGLSGARNSGVASARGAIIAFLDDDAVAAPDWLMRLSAAYDDPRVFGVGGSIVPVWSDGRPAWFPEEFDWVVGCTYRGMPQTTSPVRNLIGCNMSFRRETFEVIGGFQDGVGRVGALPMGCEETEFCIRARQHWPQRELLYEPQACVYHRVPAQRARWSYFRSRCYSEGLSKALVSRRVGAADGLASERAYTLQTLPRGVMRGIADGVLRGDPNGLGRAVAIVGGLVMTTAGYLKGVLSERSMPVREVQRENSPI